MTVALMKMIWPSPTQLTYADFATYLLFQYVTENIEGAREKYPTLAKLHASVESLPRIAQWIQERPKSLAWTPTDVWIAQMKQFFST